MKKTYLLFSLVVVLGLAVTGCSMKEPVSVNQKAGGVFHTQQEDFPEGIAVNQLEVLSKTRSLSNLVDASFSGNLTVGGYVAGDLKVASIAATNQYATTTLTAANSGTTYFLSASGTTITLPAVTTAGLNFRFAVGGALDTGNVIIDSAEGDNMDGTLIVAGAVVDCRGEDQINFVVDGEQLGDYVEVYSNGTQWFIGDSGVLISAKMTCTDPS